MWICPDPRGHLQAVGTDAAGRRQYLYHPQWREHRDREKHARVLEVARRLPEARAAVARELDTPGLTRRRVLACAFRLLDLGFFRIGGEDYAQENGTFGLATLRREHVTVHRDGSITFDYVAKSGRGARRCGCPTRRCTRVDLRAGADASGRGQELLAYQDDDGTWRDVTTADVNEYVKEHLGERQRQGLPDLARHGPRRHGARRLHAHADVGDRAQARRGAGDERGEHVSREHPGGRQGVLRRSPRRRPLP